MRTKNPEQAEKILGVAGRLFATQRFHEARMEDVAALAGVGKGTLYRYFKDKEELYLALLDRAAAGLRRCMDERVAAAAGCPREKIEAIVSAVLDYFDANPYLLDLLQHAEARQPSGSIAVWQNMRSENLHRMLDIIEEGRLAGLWEIPEPETAALMLLGGLRAVLRFWQHPRPAGAEERIVDGFLSGFARG